LARARACLREHADRRTIWAPASRRLASLRPPPPPGSCGGSRRRASRLTGS